MANRQDDILRHFPTLLRRWDGSWVRIWQLTNSHSTLTLRLEQHGRTGNLEIACIGPLHIHGPTEWPSCKVIVESCGNHFVVTDAGAGVRVETDHVEITENRKPLNAFTSASNREGYER